jgi:hypothetical protein
MGLPLIAAGVSGLAGLFGARSAASAQKKAARQAQEVQQRMFDMTRQDLSSFREMGTNAFNAYASEMGLGPRPEGFAGFQATPGFQFRMNEATDAVQAAAAARGMLRSGGTMAALSDRAGNVASQEYGTFLDRLGGMATIGQNAAAQTGAAGQNYAQGMTNAFAARGNAASAGAIGSANAIQGAIGNGLAAWQYLNPRQGAR